MLSNRGTVEQVEKWSALFAVSPPGVALDCETALRDPRVLAAYDVDEQMICMRSDLLHPRLVAHEFGHHVYHMYNGSRCPSEELCEAWAYFFEVMYMADGFDFLCQVCRSTKPIKMLSSGEVECLKCGSVYGLQFY